MRLTSKAQAEAFVFFMLNEKNRHLDDIKQIEGTVAKVISAFKIDPVPTPDPTEKYWVEVGEDQVALGAGLAGVCIEDDDGDPG